jgi:hypothetical protein
MGRSVIRRCFELRESPCDATNWRLDCRGRCGERGGARRGGGGADHAESRSYANFESAVAWAPLRQILSFLEPLGCGTLNNKYLSLAQVLKRRVHACPQSPCPALRLFRLGRLTQPWTVLLKSLQLRSSCVRFAYVTRPLQVVTRALLMSQYIGVNIYIYHSFKQFIHIAEHTLSCVYILHSHLVPIRLHLCLSKVLPVNGLVKTSGVIRSVPI